MAYLLSAAGDSDKASSGKETKRSRGAKPQRRAGTGKSTPKRAKETTKESTAPKETVAKATAKQVKPSPTPSLTPRRTTMTEQMEQATHGMMQMMADINTLARDAINANMQSMTALTKGMDDSTQNINRIMQENMARMMNAGKVVATAKSMREVMDMQQEFMRECMDMWMSGAGKMSEISARTVKDAVEPVAQHANNAMGRMMQKTTRAA